ncbi:hypothetical protein SEUCBS139899_003431 [Sporothrix eucalyptigena]
MKKSLTLQQFLARNPAVANNATNTTNTTNAANCEQLLPDYDICVLVEGMEPGGNRSATNPSNN